ncbi:hypothetical protein FHS23_004171 [Prauserella isguenensis]|uniref:Uncharacterized protein n=1 Tax=Prauserella isguenensis TaxID=1470180 RepID=A0A839S5Z5_9PSEU|nr:hypothetical protein [Prauserella isguenensis]
MRPVVDHHLRGRAQQGSGEHLLADVAHRTVEQRCAAVGASVGAKRFLMVPRSHPSWRPMQAFPLLRALCDGCRMPHSPLAVGSSPTRPTLLTCMFSAAIADAWLFVHGSVQVRGVRKGLGEWLTVPRPPGGLVPEWSALGWLVVSASARRVRRRPDSRLRGPRCG